MTNHRASNEEDYDELGLARFLVILVLGVVFALSLIYIAVSLPDDPPTVHDRAKYGERPTP